MIVSAIHADPDAHQNVIHVVNHPVVRNHVVHNHLVVHSHIVHLSVTHAVQHHVVSQDAQHTHLAAHHNSVSLAQHVLHVRHVRQSAHLVVRNWCVERPQVEMYSGSEGFAFRPESQRRKM